MTARLILGDCRDVLKTLSFPYSNIRTEVNAMKYDRNVVSSEEDGRFVSKFRDIRERFMFHVSKSDGCWMWKSATSRDGYGKFQVRRRVSARAHRVSWSLFRKGDPAGKIVRHLCNEPLCVRPDHLALGTQRDNIHDAIRAGTFPRGSKNGMTNLTEGDVSDIRNMLRGGVARKEIASQKGVKVGVIHGIASRRTWRHVP